MTDRALLARIAILEAEVAALKAAEERRSTTERLSRRERITDRLPHPAKGRMGAGELAPIRGLLLARPELVSLASEGRRRSVERWRKGKGGLRSTLEDFWEKDLDRPPGELEELLEAEAA